MNPRLDRGPYTPSSPLVTDIEAVARVCEAFEPGLRILAPTMFPHGCCGWSSEILLEALAVADIGPVNVRLRRGTYTGFGHTWIVTSDDIYIDPTLGQFVGGPALHIVLPTDEIYTRYAWR